MIFGASGRLGRALWASRPHELEVTALTRAELDVTDIRAMEAVIALAAARRGDQCGGLDGCRRRPDE